MNAFKIIPTSVRSIEELNVIIEKNSRNLVKTEEIELPQGTHPLKQFAIGATCVIGVLVSDAPTMAMQDRIVDVSQVEFNARIQELSQDPISRIQKEVAALSVLQSYDITSRIDGEEIDREVEIISNYMKKTKSFYKSRKKNFNI